MNLFLLKVRLIFIPYLLISIGTVLLYCFLSWLIFVRLELFPHLNDNLIVIALPAAITLIPVLALIRPKVLLLALKVGYRKDPYVGILLLCWATVGMSTGVAQCYMFAVTGKLTKLDRSSDIRQHPLSKYYTVNQFYPSKSLVHVYVRTWRDGGRHPEFNVGIYAMVPVFDNQFPDTTLYNTRAENHPNPLVVIDDTLSSMVQFKLLPGDSGRHTHLENPPAAAPLYGDSSKNSAISAITRGFKKKSILPHPNIHPSFWLQLVWLDYVSASASIDRKKQLVHELIASSNYYFGHARLTNFQYLQQVPYDEIREKSLRAIASYSDVDSVDNQVVLRAVYTPFSQRTGDDLSIFAGFYFGGAAIFLLIVACCNLKDYLIPQELQNQS